MRNLLAAIWLTVILSGCYGGVNVISDFGRNATYSPDSTKIVFFKFVQVYKSAKGLWSLPDGGMPKVLYKSVSVYYLNLTTDDLVKIFDYNGITSNRDSWRTKTFYTDTSIIFSIEPTIGWESEVKYRASNIDTTNIKKNKSWFSYNHKTKKVNAIPEPLDELTIYPISFNQLRGLTNHFLLKDWGVNIYEVYPQSKSQMLRDISHLKHSKAYTIEMINQRASELSEKEINRTIKNIDRHFEKQSDYQRMVNQEKRDAVVKTLLEANQSIHQNVE